MNRQKDRSITRLAANFLVWIVLIAPLNTAEAQGSKKLDTDVFDSDSGVRASDSQIRSSIGSDAGPPCEKSNGQGIGLQRLCQDTSGNGVARGDFNGDGFADLAIGLIYEKVSGESEAGAVIVIYGSANGLSPNGEGGVPASQLWTQDSPGVPGTAETMDHFGGPVVSGSFNDDGFSDLAIGVAFEASGSTKYAGAVNIIYGSPNGLTTSDPNVPASQIWTQGSPGVPGVVEYGDAFGTSMSWGDFNCDNIGDLAIGAINEKVGVSANAGAVNVLYGAADGLSSSGSQIWTQDSLGVPDQVESDDHFGLRMAAGDFNGDGCFDLAIGTPLEDLEPAGADRIPHAGVVNVIYGSFGEGLTATSSVVPPSQLWTQDSNFIQDLAEPQDEFGTTLATGDLDGNGAADLVIGVPNEDLTNNDIGDNEGAFHVIYGRSVGLSATSGIVIGGRPDVTAQYWTENTAGVPEDAEVHDNFGSRITAGGDFNGDGIKDVALGLPYEQIDATHPRTGAVIVIYGSSFRLSSIINPAQIWTEDSQGIMGTAESNDGFGASVSAWNYGRGPQADLAVRIPGQDVAGVPDAGVINVIYGSGGGLAPAFNQVFSRDTPGVPGSPKTNDGFAGSIY